MSINELAGIHDVDDFFTDRYVGGSARLDLDRSQEAFDIRHANVLWMYHNIRAGSSVLHFGCGVGRLAALKRKNCRLYGVETSPAAAHMAREVA